MEHFKIIDELACIFQEQFHLDCRTVDGVVDEYKRKLTKNKDTVNNANTLEPGSRVKVQLDGGIYEVSRSAKEPNRVSCNCPAWMYQRLNPLVRTCKHCRYVCGSENEAARISANKATLIVMNKTLGKNYRVE
jgi:hypothetical protein